MATKYWNGSTDGDLNKDANWTPSGVPTADDDLVFDNRTTRSVDIGLDTFNNVDLGSIAVRRGYTGSIGAVDAPMEFLCSAGTVYLAGSGTYYLQCDAGAEADGSVLKCIVNSAGSVYLSSQANDEGNAAVWTEVEVVKGSVYFQGDSEKANHGGDSGTAITTLKVTPISTCAVIVGDKCVNFKADTPMNVIMGGGVMTCSSRLGNVQLLGGALTFGSATIDMDTADDDIDTLTIGGAAVFYWVPRSASGTVLSDTPTITNLNVISGTFNATGTKDTESAAPTITTVWQYGGVVDLRNTFANFVVPSFYAEGGSLYYSPGQVLELK